MKSFFYYISIITLVFSFNAEAAAKPEKKTDSIFPKVSFKDNDFELKFDFITRIKNKNYLSGVNIEDDDQNLIAFRQLRPGFTFKIGEHTKFRYVVEFAKSDGKTIDAFFEHKFNDALGITAGKFKAPVSYENLISDADILFTERSMLTDLMPSRDVGLQFFGKPLKFLEYRIGYFFGRDNRSALNYDYKMNKKIAGRFDVAPFLGFGGVAEGIKLGLGYGISDRDDPKFAFQSLSTSNARERFFGYSRGVSDGGRTTYLSPVISFTNANYGGFAEYVMNRQEVKTATAADTLRNTGWQITLAYNLTGEKLDFRKPEKPARKFNLETGDLGAFQVVFRAAQLNPDDDSFPRFADASRSAKKATEFTIGSNWYLNENVTLQSNLSHTNFAGGKAGGLDRDDEIAFVNMLQIKF